MPAVPTSHFVALEMNRPLPTAAENLRMQIKEMIPTAFEDNQTRSPKDIVFKNDGKGNKIYSGDLLGKLVSRLVEEMKIGEACLCHYWCFYFG